MSHLAGVRASGRPSSVMAEVTEAVAAVAVDKAETDPPNGRPPPESRLGVGDVTEVEDCRKTGTVTITSLSELKTFNKLAESARDFPGHK